MGGATRFMSLLAAPLPSLRPSFIVLRHSVSPLLCGWTLSSRSRIKYISSCHVNSFHSQTNNNAYSFNSATTSEQQQLHPWLEWTHFINAVTNGKGLSAPVSGEPKIQSDDAFVVYEELPEDFMLAASTCLAFAHSRPNLLRLLSRKNIQVVVANGTPFLFKTALECSRRMRTFLETSGSNVPEYDRATMVDLMKYLISYASNPPISSTKSGLYSRELVDTSVRHLLHELVTVSFARTGHTPPLEHQLSVKYGEVPRPLGRNIEMKRGDWVCPKCNFMNFARNMKCLECEEIRPKKQLTGSEWECPQCNFFNYGKNIDCLRCDCRQPGVPTFNANSSMALLGNNGDYSLNNRNAKALEKAQDHNPLSAFSPQRTSNDLGNLNETKRLTMEPGRDNLSFISVQNNGTEFSPSISESGVDYEKFSPDQTEEPARSDFRNQAIVSSNTLSTGQNFEKKLSIQDEESDITQGTSVVEKSDSWFKKVVELHKTEDLPSEISDRDIPDLMPILKGENRFVVSKRKDRSLTSPKYKRQVAMDQASGTNFVPFVPFPPGHFARKETEQPDGLDSPVKAMSDDSSSKATLGLGASVSSNRIVGGSSAASTNGIKPAQSENLEFSLSTPAHSSNTAYKSDNWADKYTGQQNKSQIGSSGASSEPFDNIRTQWTGKSLEGSAVKEADPLDMSEEAKAERWFKRVAQIKDISELSQIPEEDFPSIMPMRKGVNRFVVSKRKTPLERKLASQQYRRNLPIASNEHTKKDTDSS